MGRKLLQTSANNWEVSYLNGILDSKSGKLQRAREHLEHSTKLNSDSAEAQAALGSVLAQLKDMRGAKEHLEKAIALGDTSSDIKQTLSDVLLSLGEVKAEQ